MKGIVETKMKTTTSSGKILSRTIITRDQSDLQVMKRKIGIKKSLKTMTTNSLTIIMAESFRLIMKDGSEIPMVEEEDTIKLQN